LCILWQNIFATKAPRHKNEYYYFGAVFPDTFSFSHDKKIRDISNFLHGETGIPPDGVVFDVLDMEKRVGDKKNMDGLMNEGIKMGVDTRVQRARH
jgi:hypothetical protein